MSTSPPRPTATPGVRGTVPCVIQHTLPATALPPLALAVVLGLLGAILASFLCVVAERVPAHETLGGRSHCVCGRQLSGLENIPVLSWLVLRGRARCCGARIPAYYVLAEAVASLNFAGSALVTRNPFALVTVDVLTCAGVLAAGLARTRRTLAGPPPRERQ